MPFSRLTLVFVVASCALIGAAAPITASSGAPKISIQGVRIMVTGNCGGTRDDLAAAIREHSGGDYIYGATAFDTSAGTPEAYQIDPEDLVISLGGDCGYADAAAYGDILAHYIDDGGAVLQVAYDNANSDGAHPTGRFASGGYAPLDLGPADNSATTLGTVLKPDSPFVQGLGTFVSSDNTTTPLAVGATLLAKWADGRNAIAIKGRVVATSASADDSSAFPDIVGLALNTLHYFRYEDHPETTIARVRVNSGRRLAAFRFRAVGFASGFKCVLTKQGTRGRFKACSSPKRYPNLEPGTYLFRVQAVGRYRQDPTPAKKSFRIVG